MVALVAIQLCHLLKRLFFLHWIAFGPLSKGSWADLCGSMSGFSILLHWSIVYSLPIQHCLDFCGYVIFYSQRWAHFFEYSFSPTFFSFSSRTQVMEMLDLFLLSLRSPRLCSFFLFPPSLFSFCCLDWLGSFALSVYSLIVSSVISLSYWVHLVSF